jgi:hypothetical protein
MNRKLIVPVFAFVSTVSLLLSGCKPAENAGAGKSESGAEHVHADGTTHGDHGEDVHAEGEDHGHDEAPLGTTTVGDMKVELAQGHGKVEAGKEGHLVVKLPYNDKGATTVRAWIGTEDRLKSLVGKGEYASSHDDYDIHAVAPSPLPENVMWWMEIEKPDGTKVVGSAKPILE